MDDALIDSIVIDALEKGLPPGIGPATIREVANLGIRVLSDDIPLPLLVLRQSALDHNSAWMTSFLELTGTSLAPHGKTSMSPQLFRRQMADGAWGMTLSNIHQLKVGRHFGLKRIVLANELVGRGAIRYVLEELEKDPEFDFFCLVDSSTNVEAIAELAREKGMTRPVQMLVEAGIAERRAGCRTLDAALDVARAVSRNAPYTALRGVEGFEGVVNNPDPARRQEAVTGFIDFLCEIARRCEDEGLFADGEVILSGGGSAYFDIVASRFGALKLRQPTRTVLRPGCYLTHDSHMLRNFMAEMKARRPDLAALGETWRPALEVWAHVVSRPQPDHVIVGLGKRDASYDAGFPVPFAMCRPGRDSLPVALEGKHVAIEMNDQHLFLKVPADSSLEVGDMIGFGISHPCLTLDKWRFIPVVDDDYVMVSAVTTAF
ncbi:amino acid deaminase [Mesorhizobium sp. ZMM04-5]|uniref:Amino acid deaminase n=1 Tax=Mesorhizobium marinum TaxID=3228790 RepID=A0ABV3R4M4_9HYPH